MADSERERTLDAEGIPDLQGPLPEKVATGDAQEGVPPPSEKPASLDWGTTPLEERLGDPIRIRVQREEPDLDERPVGEPDAEVELIAPEDEDVDRVDTEADLVGRAAEPGITSLPAEEAAVHVLDEPPEAIDDDPGDAS